LHDTHDRAHSKPSSLHSLTWFDVRFYRASVRSTGGFQDAINVLSTLL
jgi:hypothetical protein